MSSWPHLVDAEEITGWSRRIDSFSQFPGIVRMLVKRNNDQLVRLDMRAAEGVRIPGYDGIVEAVRGTTLVPAGRSVWEMGVNTDFKSKAKCDYDKRTQNPLGENPAETTFVFVTPHRWRDKEAWERERRESGPWKDVRILDVDNLMAALEEAHAVHVRLSELLGKPATGVRSIEDWWDRFCAKSSPMISTDMALAGRADEAAHLLSMFDETRSFTTIRAKSIDDVLAFVAATMLTTEPTLRTDLLARTLIVHDAVALRQLDGSESLLILLPFEEQMRREAELVQSNHVLFMCEEEMPADIELPNIDIGEATRLLVGEGVERELAAELAKAAGVSLQRFQRVASRRKMPQPEWSAAFSDRDVRRAWLLRSWTTARSGDVETFERMVGKSFAEVEDAMRKATRGPDPIFSTVGTVWSVVSPADFWDHVRPYLTTSDLELLERCVQDVLGAVDPALELPPEERWTAAVRGLARLHSHELRRGLATTLALIGTRGESAALSGTTGGIWVQRVLYSLFARINDDDTGQSWASLTDVLPLLAEAAPDIFLSALDTALRHPDTALSQMITDNQGASFTTASPHTGLLWALEITAWFPAHFGQTVNALAALSTIDPGGRLSNRPFKSLIDIFRLWWPQTLVDRADRVAALKTLVERYPDVGSRLLVDLLPNGPDTAMNNEKPKFRVAVLDSPKVDPREFSEAISEITSLLLPIMRQRPEFWPDLLDHVSSLPSADRERIYTALPESIAVMPEGESTALWEKASDLIRRHREYSNAAWALPSAELARLEETIIAARPRDSRGEARWLFDQSHPDIGVSKNHNDYEAQLSKLRCAALRKILNQHGLSGVTEFAKLVKYPYLVGAALAEVDE